MKHNIKYSPTAISDLDKLYDYIFNELNNPVAAKNTLSGILEAIAKISDFPLSGTSFCLPTGEQTIYRNTAYKNYMVFYHFQNEKVYIDRVIYGKRDYIKILFSNL